jgi:hypothetical protein
MLTKDKNPRTTRHWRHIMTRSPEHLDTDCDQERDAHTRQIVYLVRRPGYEFVFSVPTTRVADLSGEQARFQARFRDQQQGQEFVLSLEDLEDFYASLSHLIEYVRIEQQQRPRTDEVRPDHGDSPTRG